MILGFRTDKPKAELWLADASGKIVDSYTWLAHRELAETIHIKVEELLNKHKKNLSDLTAMTAFLGPGSFTGLRIGLSVANALADSLNIPAAGSQGGDWFAKACNKLESGANELPLLPDYGGPAFTTSPKK